MMDWSFLLESAAALLAGLPLTLNLAVVSVAAGTALALIFTILTLTEIAPLVWLVRGYVFVLRGTPLLLQIFLIYYGLGQFRPTLEALGLWSFLRDPYWCAIVALALNTAAYIVEIIRGGLGAVPRGALEAAASCGMSPTLRFRRITLPLAIRHALPAYSNELILMVKATSLASVITMMEVTGVAGKLISETYRSVEVFICAGAIYLCLNFILVQIVYAIERALSTDKAKNSPSTDTQASQPAWRPV